MCGVWCHEQGLIWEMLKMVTLKTYNFYRVQELNEKANPNILITLVGNKIDLDAHQVTKEEASEYANSKGLQYYEVSAKQNENISNVFRDIAMKLPA